MQLLLGGRRDSMDRNSQTAFSPSLIDQFNKGKANPGGWPAYGLGAGKSRVGVSYI